jgi:hypothetical protein
MISAMVPATVTAIDRFLIESSHMEMELKENPPMTPWDEFNRIS